MNAYYTPIRFAIGYAEFAPFNVASTITVHRGDILTPCRETTVRHSDRPFRRHSRKWRHGMLFAPFAPALRVLGRTTDIRKEEEKEEKAWEAMAAEARAMWASENEP